VAEKLIKQYKLTKRPKVKTTKVVPKTRREIMESDDYKEARLFDARKAHTARTKKRDLPGPETVDASDAGRGWRYAGSPKTRRDKLEYTQMLGSSKRPGGYRPEDWKKTGVPFFGSSRASKIVNHANPGTKAREKRSYSNKRKK